MKKLSLLIAIAMLLSIGGVYATWVYSQSSDVADITGAKAITMTEATFTGTYGTYSVDTSGLTMVVDPKQGTAHVTSLKIEGNLVITFTPNTYAPDDVKTGGIPTTYKFGLSNPDWKYNGIEIMTLGHNGEAHEIQWTKEGDTFKYTINAATLAEHLLLTEFTLDTKAEYDAYDAVLTNGQVTISISDGVSGGQNQ